MPKNYFIGIGGTGARVAESLVHLCAAGLGPEDLTLFLIDPDKGNGNLSRTTGLMEAYKRARGSFTNPAGDDVAAFRTNLSLPEPAVWHIFEQNGVALKNYVGLESIANNNPALADFAKVLFSDEEMSTALDQGFRGHPNIGATVISNVPRDSDPWQTFWQDVATEQAPNAIQVFLVGSIFGGTGAAGIPTLGAPQVLKQAPDATLGTASKIRLGAGLVLPYFSFAPGAVREGDPQMFVTAADFPVATKAALAYYADKDLAFDDVYLFGDSLAQNVGTFSPGSAGQQNRAHYIELTGALAALDFYRSTPHNGPTKYFHAARSTPIVDWDHLPVSRDTGAVQEQLDRAKERLTTFATFAYAVLAHGIPILNRDISEVVDAWHADHFAPRNMFGKRNQDKDPRQPADRQRIDAVAAYLDRFIRWAVALDPGSSGDVRLFNGKQLLTSADATPDPSGSIPNPEAVGQEHGIGTLLRATTQNQDFTAFKNVLNATDVRNVPNASVSNSDVFVNLFYRAARTFAVDNYALRTADSTDA
ncbi:MAG: hypothetical protein AAFN13_05660 [Bacteroidota bacterium]